MSGRIFRSPYAPAPAADPYNSGQEYLERQKVQRAIPTPFVEAITASRTVTPQDDSGWFLADATSGAFTITLPSAQAVPAMRVGAKKTDATANAVTVAASGSDVIDGAASYPLTVQYQSVTLMSDGGNWWVL